MEEIVTGEFIFDPPFGSVAWYYDTTEENITQEPQGDLHAYKEIRFIEIDNRTNELIESGFEYPASSGKFFGFSVQTQLRAQAVLALRDDPAMSYPIRWNTRDDQDYIDFADGDAFKGWFLTGLGTYKAHVDSGTALKDSIRVATTKAEVDAVIDNR